MQARATALLDLVERAIFDRPRSPYRALLDSAGITYADLEGLVGTLGVDGTLERLYERGVYVTIEEFKGRVPIRRHRLELAVSPSDFDNPLARPIYGGTTGGSRGSARPLAVNFAWLEQFSAEYALIVEAFGLRGRPTAIWQPLPPGIAGMATALCSARIRQPVERWFTPTRLAVASQSLRPAFLCGVTAIASRLYATPVAMPSYTPVEHAAEVAQWLARRREQGRPAVLQTTPSSAVRVCTAAAASGIDVSQTTFLLGGEPYTDAKAAIVAAAGARGISPYGMSELGQVGIPCAAGAAADDVHFALDKLAVVARHRVDANGRELDALFYTGLLGVSPKLMLNVESGDYGVVETRDCGCPIGTLGFDRHLHTIRSYEKLTSEGMSFAAEQVMALIEHLLPHRFGGSPNDYQFEEREHEGIGRVRLLVSPRVGHVDEAAVAAAVLDALRSDGLGDRMMADVWRNARTIEVVRREPYVTSANKVLPLVVRPPSHSPH
jgi:hypothetical protein